MRELIKYFIIGALIGLGLMTIPLYLRYNVKTQNESNEDLYSKAIFTRGFIAGASFQEVYRFNNPNTSTNPTIELDILLKEADKINP